MARGKPDYHRATVIEAQKGTAFQPVLLDESGHMFIALTGQEIAVNNLKTDYFKKGEAVVASGDVSVNNLKTDYFKDGEAVGSITNNVTVDQENSDRVLKGTEGENKRYISVDSAGVLLARLKGAFGEVLKDIKVDIDGIILSRMQGRANGSAKDIAVDGSGVMLARMQGDSTEGLKDVYVDTTGKMVARVQGVGGGLEPLFTVDDGGDEDLISDWVEYEDGLDPEDLQDFGKEGQHSMKLGIDVSLHGSDTAIWLKSVSVGDMAQYKDMKIYIWLYFQTIDYLSTGPIAFQYLIGTDSSNYIYFNRRKTSFNQGWNLLEIDLTDTTGTLGTIDWTNIGYQSIGVLCVTDNTHDFYVVIDLIAVVKENPVKGSLIDVATDKDGLMLSKLVGSYGELHKPINADRHGNLRTNLTDQGLWTVVANQFRGHLQSKRVYRTHPEIGVSILCDIKGPGIVMGGSCIHLANASHKSCYVRFTCDGNIFHTLSFEDLYTYNYTKAWEYVPHLTLFDDSNYIYSVSFPNNLSFESQFKVEVIEETGVVASTELILFYAIV